MKREEIIKLAREAQSVYATETWTFSLSENQLEHFAALVAAAERNKKPHSLGSGQMELSLRREHKGELFECRYRFTAEQVMHGQDWMVTEVAKQLDTEIDRSIRARSQA